MKEEASADEHAEGVGESSQPKTPEGPSIVSTAPRQKETEGAAAKRTEEDAKVPKRQEIDRGPVYNVQLPIFDGPLDLLLHLIQKHELNILDIPISFVTEKFVDYMGMMQELNIDLASEYLVMAATLAHIKSRMLLPTPPPEAAESEEELEDPRAELVRRLLEYQKYKLAAEELGGRAVLGRDIFGRGTKEAVDEGPAPLAPASLFKLLDAFQGILKRVRQTQEHHIDFERISITERINQLADLLRTRPRVEFHELFDADRTRGDIIVTFLALLEMTRLKMTRIFQDGPYETIVIELAVQDGEPGFEADSQMTEP